MEKAFESVKKLVEDFRAHERDYLSPNYQESHVRQDFIDKFFAALGWDVTHEYQKNPHEYEVQIENKVIGGKTQQRADYAFFLAPNFRDPKFFVEAKKPARQLKNPDFFYQTMRYGWNGNTPIAILTDFEEFYVIDCRLKPNIKDALDRGIKSFHYTDYADEEKFKWIYWLFSHEAVAGGSIEKFVADKLSKPKGKAARGAAKSQPVDEVFLAELDGFRGKLADAFKKSNLELQGEELTEAVQRTIDRLVFIRFLEDKLIEDKEIATLIDRQMAWNLFAAYCRKLEPKYNGLIFKPHPVIDGEKFHAPDEKVFSAICEGLAGRESPYNFDQIPISILGSIYERFLGKVVRATPKGAKVEDKPEVRKAGGVYYTPDYIVRYIVKETVGKLIEGKTPEEISKMAFADIACGSGSFLIEVYDTLLKYHERYYAENPGKAKKGDTDQREGRKVLSLKKRQEILVNNIYGVDIDYQATEVTQLSLYLKLLEDVTTNEAYQFTFLKEKILPNLSRNIVCENSLIGKDIAEGNLFPDIDKGKLKPMNFEDVFPEVMKRGGFDAVVGNPPYGAEFDEPEKEYVKNAFKSYKYKFDSYIYFIEKAIILSKAKGLVGYITPELWLKLQNCDALRSFVSKNASIISLRLFGEDVFAQVVVNTVVSIFQKGGTSGNISIETPAGKWDLKVEDWRSTEGLAIDYRIEPKAKIIIDKMKPPLVKPLSEFGEAIQGITAYDRYAGQDSATIRGRLYHFQTKKDKSCGKWLEGKDVGRYELGWSGEWLRYGPWLAAPRDPKFFNGERLLFREVPGQGKRIQATIANETLYHGHSVTPFKLDTSYLINAKYILGLVNSKLLSWYAGLKLSNFGKDVFPKLNPQDIKDIPIRTIDFSDTADKSRHDHIVKLVEQMLAAKEELSKARTEAETTRLEQVCESLDRQIDEAVYELYGLTEEERKIVGTADDR